MAPEQFVTGQSSVQSDIWALGVILYELVSGRHPFARPDGEEFQSIRAIQYANPTSFSEVPGRPAELESVIFRCLDKTPQERYSSAADVREALKTIMKALQIETGIIPGDAAANLPVSPAEAEKRATGFLSMLAERFRESAATQSKQNTMLVLPFQNFGATDVAPLYGFALADAIAARLARMSSLVVRPSSSLMSVPVAADGSVGHRAQAAGAVCAGGQLYAFGERVRSELAIAGRAGPERARRRHDQRAFLRPGRGADRDLQ